MDEQPRIDRDTYLSEYESAVDVERDQTRQFDRTILTLASGALGLSAAFIREAVGRVDPTTVHFLDFAWGSLTACILATLISFRTSAMAHRRHREILDAMYTTPADVPLGVRADSNRWAQYTDLLSWLALITFVLGVGLLAYFVRINIVPIGAT